MANTDQRKHPRFAMALPVNVHVQKPDEPVVEACTKDISSKGIYLVMPEAPGAGSKLDFEVRLPGEMTGGKTIELRCHGKIVRIDSKGFGNQMGVVATIEEYEFVKAA